MGKLTLGKMIDNSLLDGPGTQEEMERICREAVQLSLRGVSVPGCWARECSRLIKCEAEKMSSYLPPDSLPLVTAFIGQPWGETTLRAKLEEIQQAARAGTKAVEFVPNIGMFLSGAKSATAFREELTHARHICEEMGLNFRTVLPFRSLRQQKTRLREDLCRLTRSAGVTEIQPSTGWDHDITDVEDLGFLRQFFGPSAILKAAGVFNLTAAKNLIFTGANIVSGNGAVIIAQALAEAKDAQTATTRGS